MHAGIMLLQERFSSGFLKMLLCYSLACKIPTSTLLAVAGFGDYCRVSARASRHRQRQTIMRGGQVVRAAAALFVILPILQRHRTTTTARLVPGRDPSLEERRTGEAGPEPPERAATILRRMRRRGKHAFLQRGLPPAEQQVQKHDADGDANGDVLAPGAREDAFSFTTEGSQHLQDRPMRPANHAPVAAEVPGKLKIPNKTLPNRKARGGHSLLQKRHRVDGSSDDLAVDLMKDVFSLSVIVFRKDKVPVKKSRGGHWLYKFKKGFQQWCATKSDPKHKLAHNTKECVSGFNVKGKESLRQIDAHSEDYAFAFKPFFVKGIDDATLRERTSTILRADGSRLPSPAGILVFAPDYKAEDHRDDVEKGVATPEEKQNTHSRKKSLTCLTVSTGKFPHTVQALGEELQRQWESGTFYRALPLAVVSTTDPANCARWRFFSVNTLGGYYEDSDVNAEDHLGRRNVWQLRLFLPRAASDELNMPTLCLDAPLSLPLNKWHWGKPSSQLGLYTCKEDEMGQTVWYGGDHSPDHLRHQRWGLRRLDGKRFPDVFAETPTGQPPTAPETSSSTATDANANGRPSSTNATSSRSAPGGVETAPASASSASKTRFSSSPKGAAEDKSVSPRSLLSFALSHAWLLCVSVGAVFAVGMVCGCWCCVLFGGHSGSSPDPVETQEDEPLEETGGPGRGEAGPQGATGGAEGKVHVTAVGAPSSLAAAATPEHNPEAVAAGTTPRPLDSEFWTPETQGRVPNTPAIRYSLDSEMRDTLQPDSGTSFIVAAPAVSKTKRKIKSTRKGRGAAEKQNTAGL